MTVIAASTAVWVFILIPLAIVWALGIVDIVRRHLPPAQTAGWILLVVLLPLVGTLVYFLLRKPTEEEIVRAQRLPPSDGTARRASTSVCQAIDTGEHRLPSGGIPRRARMEDGPPTRRSPTHVR